MKIRTCVSDLHTKTRTQLPAYIGNLLKSDVYEWVQKCTRAVVYVYVYTCCSVCIHAYKSGVCAGRGIDGSILACISYRHLPIIACVAHFTSTCDGHATSRSSFTASAYS